MASFFIILFLALLAWFWLNSIRAKEIAMQASAEACQQIQAQFLDQTASLKNIKTRRNTNGKMVFERTFVFDFSRDRETRMQGLVTIIGYKVTQVLLDEDTGTTIL
jgi:flagellin-like hook-associated protein FlgL